MHWLDSFKKGLFKVVHFMLPFLQIASAVPSPFSGELGSIALLVGDIEQAFANAQLEKSGAQKLLAIMPQVEDILKESQLLAGRKVIDAAMFNEASVDLINGVVKLMKSVEAPK